MSLFGRGNWAVFGVDTASLSEFEKNLGVKSQVARASQLLASAETKLHGQPTRGINPFGSPRLDEEVKDASAGAELAAAVNKTNHGETVPLDIASIGAYLPSEETLALGNDAYGFWLVQNDYKDVTDPASKKEAIAYSTMGRPFRFLKKKDKELVEEKVSNSAVMARRQIPVIVDFQHGRVYAETTNKDDILAVREILDGLEAKTFSLCWKFSTADWASKFLNTINAKTRFSSEMKSRADELARLRPSEVEKLQDKEMEKVVSNFFAFTPLDSGFVGALGCPAYISIHPVSDPVMVDNPSVAFSLLGMTDDAGVAAATVTFLEPCIKRLKGGIEKRINKPWLSVDLSENTDNFDAGAALLRGMDLPQFKRTVKTAYKAQGTLEIKDFWVLWLNAMHDAILTFVDNITDTLEVDKGVCGLASHEAETESTEVEIKEV